MESWEETDERSTAGDLTRVDTFGALKHDVNSTVELYSYDGFNRMTEARKGAMTATYQYNAEGIRTSKTVNGVRTDFLLDGANVIAETKNGTTTNYIRGVSGIISSSVFGSNSLTKYYTSDGHGNITNLTNSSGDVVKTYVYDAFGVEQNIDPNDLNPFRYCGEYYDSEINQIYLRARYYNPSLGRFTQSDPARDGMNWYVYCGNNPVGRVDPTGMIWDDILKETLQQLSRIPKLKSVAKKFWEIGSELFLDNQGYDTAAWLLRHSLEDNPGYVYRNNDSDLARRINHDKDFNYALTTVLNRQTGDYFLEKTVPIIFTQDKDLYYSFYHCTAYMEGYKNPDGSWTVQVIIKDRYDYTESKIISEGLNYANAANDAAVISQLIDVIHPFDITVSFWVHRD